MISILKSIFQDDFASMSSHVNSLFRSNAIKPIAEHKYKLEEAAKAHNDVINNSGTTGRLTLLIN